MKRLFLIVFFCAFFLSLKNSAQAACGCSGCPLDAPSNGSLGAGEARLSLNTEYIHLDQPRISRRKAAVGEIAGHHDEVETLNTVRTFGLAVGLSSRFSAEVEVPFVHREHTHIHNHMGTPSIHTWNYDGMGDTRLKINGTAFQTSGTRPLSLQLTAGVEFPTGRDHAANADGDEAEPGILPSDNAYAFLAGMGLRKSLLAKTWTGQEAEMPVFISTLYQWNEPGVEDYRIGNNWILNAGAAYPVLPKLSVLLQSNLRVARRDDKGKTHEETEKTGGTFVYVSPGLQLGLSEALSTFIIVQIPVYQRVNVIQLTSDYNLSMGVSYKFSLL
jgi:hypothetical protein